MLLSGCLLLLFSVSGYDNTVVRDQLAGVKTIDVQAVEGSVAELPCSLDVGLNDKVYMVFWFRDNAGVPIYSFDVRGKPLSEGSHWSSPNMFGPRAHFSAESAPAQLLVRDVKRRDEGVYRCRVDFRNTQTNSVKLNLTVIVPPEKPVVVDRWGRVINATTLGPHREGDDVLLTCRVLGGRPEPMVRWKVNGVLVDDEYEHNSGYVIENRLTWPSVKRTDYAAVFTCQAINSPHIQPVETSLVLDMYLRPLSVVIEKPPEVVRGAPLIAERRYEVRCVSIGSRPPAVITWHKGKRLLKRINEEVLENSTVSVLSFVPTVEDDGRQLLCRAENPNVTSLQVDASWTLSVNYPPVVHLRLGSSFSAVAIKEGDDVYFECHVRANPPARRLTWLRNDGELRHNSSARVLHSNQSLVLQKVTRESSGRYACGAINDEGETISNELHFTVKYSPRCKEGSGPRLVGAGRGEQLVVVCEVEADPPATAFRWKFNSSGETSDVTADTFVSNGTTSTLRYAPVTDMDFGTLSCFATNSIGTQKQPCLFQMVAASKPQPLRNCSVWNQTSSSVEVSCEAGFDGGLPQKFMLELFSPGDKHPKASLQSDEPQWSVTGLAWGVPFRGAAVAVNPKGRSPPALLLDTLLFSDPEKRTAASEVNSGAWGVAWALGAAAALTALGAVGAQWGRKSRRKPSVDNKAPPVDDHEPDLIPNNYCDDDTPFDTMSSSPPALPNSHSATLPLHFATRHKSAPSASSPHDLHIQSIKEKLLDHSIPESCV